MKIAGNIHPCLWFDSQAEEAARFYASVFPNSRIAKITHYTEAGQETHKRPPGSVLTVEFELNGQPFLALNGGPQFRFSEAISLVVPCKTQEQIDYFWQKLSADPASEQCGWVKDRYGLSWQIAPADIGEMLSDSDTERAGRVMTAMMEMKKIDIERLHEAYEGAGTTASSGGRRR
jgi:predicted 3-demethylubiquinone-9 3-methyltransferase (glyoxalase superfamily)